MSVTNVTEIRRLAQAFRKGIERAIDSGEISWKTTNSTMPIFPRGCCEIASDLLAEYLLENGIYTKSIHGECDFDNREAKFPHTWLETEDGIIVDITADQFAKEMEFKSYDLMPCNVSTDRSFYSLFTEDYREEEFHGLKNCDGDFYRKNIDPLYGIILRHIS